MKKIRTFKLKGLIIFCCCVFYQISIFAQSNQDIFPKPKNGNTYVIAHRGVHIGIPENSIPAYKKAIELGCDFIEIDARSTKDGHVVSIHNSTVDAYVKNVTGKVNDFTLEELRILDIGELVGPEWKNTRIPTLDEILQLCRGNIGIYLDLKEPLIEKIVTLIRKYNMESNVFWYVPVSHVDAIFLVKQLCPDCIAMPDPGKEINLEPTLQQLKPMIVAPVMKDFSETYVETAHKYGAKVFVDEDRGGEREWNRMLKLGADGIQTDNPEALINYLNAREK